MKNKIILLISVFTFFLSKDANCCYCVSGTMSDSFKNSNLIIIGTVLSVRDESPKRELNFYKIYTVQIEKLYKGHYRRKTVEIVSGAGDEDCGFYFKHGEKYIIFARIFIGSSSKISFPNKSFFTDECTRTKKYNEKEVEEIKKYKRKHLFWWI
jgi:hypothetical protein